MNISELQTQVTSILGEMPENILRVYFSYWQSDKYVSYVPQLSTALQKEIVNTVLTPLAKKISDHNLVEYNPVGVADGEVEELKVSSIPNIETFKASLLDETVFKSMDTLEISKIDFYCLEILCDEKNILIFRQFQKLKKLRKGLLTQILNDELVAMDGDFLGIDDISDILVYGEDVLLLNHISLERIFKYRDEFLKKTKEALGELLTKNIIVNIDKFTEDCQRDIRIMKKFTNIMTKDRLPLFFDNFDKVDGIVKDLDLDIEFEPTNETGVARMIYRDRSQLFHIVNLLSDSYFKSLIAERTGLAKIESEV